MINVTAGITTNASIVASLHTTSYNVINTKETCWTGKKHLAT